MRQHECVCARGVEGGGHAHEVPGSRFQNNGKLMIAFEMVAAAAAMAAASVPPSLFAGRWMGPGLRVGLKL